MAERLRFGTTVLDMDSIQLRDLVKPTVVIVAISTAGQGEMPQNARRFWKRLLSSALKPGLLRKIRFSSFGIGDSSYPRFNVAHRMLHSRLVQLGAQAFCERGEGNEQHPEGHSAAFRTWIVALKEKLLEAFPLSEAEPPIADDVFLEPRWKLELAQPASASEQLNGDDGTNAVCSTGNARRHETYSTNGVSEHTTVDAGLAISNPDPSPALLPLKGAYTANIVQMERVTASNHFQDVRLLDLHITKPYSYGPGAVAVVYPKNFPPDVQDFIKLMAWQGVADVPLRLVTSAQSMTGSSVTPSPLRHLDLSQMTLTLRWLLENVLDIMSIPRRSFFASLAYFAGSDTEDESYQKERLLELANPELIDELWDYTTRPKRTIVEVVMDFTTIKIPWQYALSVLPMMKGRQFSIASGGQLKQDKHGATRVELLIAIADPPSPIIKWRRRYGVCTRYITALQAGQQISIGLQQGYLDVQPSEIEVPVIMIGPGTGVAPMRSMIHQRLVWADRRSFRPHGQRMQGDILIFGCRSETADFFFREEWDHLAQEEGLTVLTAFSRDLDMPKQYVQDLIRVNAERVHDALVLQQGKVYVCGSSGNMPKGVREALVDVLVERGDGLTKDDAEAYMDGMEKEGRYKQETW
ncbi:hypothetical protein LTR36_008117 [Oleoguttula mirabilis]|uniref:NADPH-dependent diflavin oxidoreductase 1 n=1 Tax=Oleoguttula mirabilis TaxID=1507867 RepID=A0AAV9J8E9_9PEZI|nr:hypothetical protein LTR36_008117 [Oleoguttula mirabilis]